MEEKFRILVIFWNIKRNLRKSFWKLKFVIYHFNMQNKQNINFGFSYEQHYSKATQLIIFFV